MHHDLPALARLSTQLRRAKTGRRRIQTHQNGWWSPWIKSVGPMCIRTMMVSGEAYITEPKMTQRMPTIMERFSWVCAARSTESTTMTMKAAYLYWYLARKRKGCTKKQHAIWCTRMLSQRWWKAHLYSGTPDLRDRIYIKKLAFRIQGIKHS